jgi:hypothetical protein
MNIEYKNPVFRNYTAAVAWAFMLFWLMCLTLFTHLFFTQKVFGLSPLAVAGIMSMFWCGGIAGATHFFSLPCSRAEVRNAALFIREWTFWNIFRPREHRFDLFEQPPATEVLTESGDDGPYYRLVIPLPNGSKVLVTEGHDLDDISSAQSRLIQLWSTI